MYMHETTVWAGGYEYFVEILVNALAYEFDGLKNDFDRTMGLMCDEKDWDKNAKKCKTAWQKWSSKGPRANINEILIHLIDLSPSLTNLVRDSSNNSVFTLKWVEEIDLKKTAVNLFNQATNKHGGNLFTVKLTNFPNRYRQLG